MDEEQKPEVKELSIKDFPILERSQFFFVSSTPMREELMTYVRDSGLKDKYFSGYSKWPDNYKLAHHIIFDQRRPVIYKDTLLSEYGQKIADNAKSYMINYIKMPSVQKPDHYAIVAWFVEQIVDIEKTAAYNNWKL